MRIDIMYFGSVAEAVGSVSETVEVKDDIVLGSIQDQLELNYPDLTSMQYNIAVNQRISKSDSILKAYDVLALLPPFAGG